MLEKFRTIKYQKKTFELLQEVKAILKEFSQQNIKVTVRQAYYQLVSRNIIPNNKKQYNKISELLKNARYTGDLDWYSIEDRTRIPKIPSVFNGVQDFLETAISQYQLDKWKEQEYYIELWTEKDALSSVIYPIASKYQVTMNVCRGFSSTTSMYDSRIRFIRNSEIVGNNTNRKRRVLLYLGDFDPSGLDMDRDIKERFNEFGVDIDIKRIGLTIDQIEQYTPPPNYIKEKDTRMKNYIQKYGVSSCWEVDALNPRILQELIENSILSYLDLNKFKQVQKQEIEDIEKTRVLINKHY